MALDDLIKLLPQHERQRLEQAVAAQRDLLEFYLQTHQEIMQAMQYVLRNATSHNLKPSVVYSLVRQSQLLDYLEARIADLNTSVAQYFVDKSGPLSILVQAQVSREVRALGAGSFPEVSLPDPALIEKHLVLAVNRISSWNRQMIPAITRQLRTGILKGEDYNQLNNRMSALRRTPEGTATPLAQARAHMLANVRYSVVSAANSAREEAYSEAVQKHDLNVRKMWWAAIDSCCVSCAHLHGQIADLNKDFDWKNLGLTITPWKNRLPHPPLHPNCRCRIIPITPDLVTTLDLSQIAAARRTRVRELSRILQSRRRAA